MEPVKPLDPNSAAGKQAARALTIAIFEVERSMAARKAAAETTRRLDKAA